MQNIISPQLPSELLELYGWLPRDNTTVSGRWEALTANWVKENSPELGQLRQIMLRFQEELKE